MVKSVDDEAVVSAQSSGIDIHPVLEKHADLTIAETRHDSFLSDPNQPDKMEQYSIHGKDVVELASTDEGAIVEDSPYEEVRSAVPPTDDPSMPVNTIRVWVLGMLFVTLGSGLNMLFSMRAPSIIISSIVAQLLSHWCGKAWEKTLPNKTFRVFGLALNLNPGKFNVKEHTVITIMSNVSFGGGQAYATSIIISQEHYYGQRLGFLYQLILVWSTQIIGFGLAGVARRFLVWPGSMIWPTTLINAALFHTLHKDHEPAAGTTSWRITRFRFFMYVLAGGFLWYWFPGYLAPFLSVFAFVTWIKPNNVIINQVFGGFTGLSLLPITFDWTQIAGYLGSPLAYPAHVLANIFAGVVVIVLGLTPGLHYGGAWFSEFLPISDSTSYDNTQAVYNVTKIITPDFELDVTKYQSYSPLFLSTTFALSYGVSFATIAAVITHTLLFNGKALVKQWKTRGEDDDVHMSLMRRYREVPNWWYLVIFTVSFVMSMCVTQLYETHLAWWAFILAILIATAWFIPVGYIQGITNVQIGLNVITEFVIGYMQPGKPVAMMCFKTYGYITMSQGLSFVQDLKLGHYMKIPPRTLFFTQVAATVWGSLVEVLVMRWALSSIKDVCTKHAVDGFSCPQARVFYTASVIWGLLGPARIFSIGQIYSGLLWFFLVGFVAPIPIWLLARRRPESFWKYVNIPVFFGSTGAIPPATPLNYFSFCIVGWVFNYIIKRRSPAWWSRYNYVLSAALDSGLAICTIFIFLALSMTGVNGGSFVSWWGTDVVESTMDAQDTAIRTMLAEGQKFGPTTW